MLLLLACTGRQAAPPAPKRVVLSLDHGWTHEGAALHGTDPSPISMSLSFDLPAELAQPGSLLVLEGLRDRAVVTVNGTATPEVVGGNAPAEVVVGPHLRAGQNTLTIDIAAIAGDSKALVGQPDVQWRLGALPTLVIRPATHIEWVSLPLVGDDVRPIAGVEAAPEGATVRFFAALDGEILQALGQAPVVNGVARGELSDWDGPRWGRGEASDLFHLVAVLEDSAGSTLDSAAWRTGARSVSFDEALLLSGEKATLLGARLSYGGDLVAQMRVHADAGLNSGEYHGDPWDRRTMELADEIGLPVAFVPRCDGRVRFRESAYQNKTTELEAQDERLLSAAAHHPSLVLWVQELRIPHDHPLTASLTEDPSDRPVVQVDLPGAPFPVLKAGAPYPTKLGDQGPWWIIELTNGPPDQVPVALRAALSTQALGGVLRATDSINRNDPWMRTAGPEIATIAQELGAAPLPSSRRASSLVELSGPAPGTVVWIEVPHAGGFGTVVGSETTRLSAWHEGDAVVRVGDASHPVTLDAGEWKRFERIGGATQLAL